MSRLKKSKCVVGIAALAAVVAVAGARMLAATNQSVALFSVELGGSAVSTAVSYPIEPIERSNKVFYSLKIARHLSSDTSWVNALQSGTVYNPAVVRVYDASLAQLNTYTIANASVVSVRHTGLASDPFVIEEIALLGTSLSVTTP